MNDEIVDAIVNLRKQTGRVEERLPLMPLNNYAGAAAPTEDDDVTQGWTVLSNWVYDGSVYICIDNSEGAAVWKELQFVTGVTYDTITFVSFAENNVASSTTLTITKPAGLTTGHVMMATIFVDSNAVPVTPPDIDWVEEETSSGGGMTLKTYSKVADAGDVAASNFTFTIGTPDGMAGIISAWSGVDNTTPVGATTPNTGLGTSATGLSVTSTIDNSVILYSGGQQSGSTDYGAIGSYTQVTEEDLSSSPFGSVVQFYRTLATAGASGDATSTLTGSQDWHTHMLVLNPAEL